MKTIAESLCSSISENVSTLPTLFDEEKAAQHDPPTKDEGLAMNKVATSTSSQHEPYSIFSKSKKTLILLIIASTGILSTLSANIYFPALDAIKDDLHTTTELINLTVTGYMIFQGLAPAVWGPLADTWGRRPVYIATLAVYLGSCVGLALAPAYHILLILRMLQAIGASSVIAIGAGVVGDTTTPSERGTFFGVFSCGQMLAPVIGPVLGGIISQELSWRWIFWILLMIGGVLFAGIVFLLPETLRSLVGNGSAAYCNPTPDQWLKRRVLRKQGAPLAPTVSGARFRKIPNVLEPVRYLFEKDVFAALLFNALHYAVYYCYLTSTSTLFADIYNLSELQVGLCYLCQGVACILGSLTEGRILDRDFRITAKQAGIPDAKSKGSQLSAEFPIFKARLRTVWIQALLVQAVTIAYGWVLWVNAHLAAALILQFFSAYGVTAIYNVFQTLLIDLFTGKSASISATNNLLRCLIGAAATVAIEPGIQRVGTGWMFTILGLILVVSNALLPILLKYGPRWRAARMEKNQAKLAENIKV